MKKTILVVEDDIHQALDSTVTLLRVAQLKFAFNLKQAMDVLAGGGIDGVITDLCFHERGTSVTKYFSDSSSPPIPYRSWIVDGGRENAVQAVIHEYLHENHCGLGWHGKEALKATLLESATTVEPRSDDVQVSILGNTSEKLRKEVARASIAATNHLSHTKVVMEALYSIDWNTDSNRVPALGYQVADYCVRNNIPVSFLSSVGHAERVIFAAHAARLLTDDELASCLIEWNKDTEEIHVGKGIFVRDSSQKGALWNECFNKLQFVD